MAETSGLTLEVQLRAAQGSRTGKRYIDDLIRYHQEKGRGNGWALYADGAQYVQDKLDDADDEIPDWEHIKRRMWGYYNHTDYDWRVVLSTGEVVVDLKAG